jgi:hypothetical protein
VRSREELEFWLKKFGTLNSDEYEYLMERREMDTYICSECSAWFASPIDPPGVKAEKRAQHTHKPKRDAMNGTIGAGEGFKIEFAFSSGKPENMVCEAEVHLTDGPLAGLKIVGFSIYRDVKGELYVTLPARAFGAGMDRRYFDYIRSSDGDHSKVQKVKELIIKAFVELPKTAA